MKKTMFLIGIVFTLTLHAQVAIEKSIYFGKNPLMEVYLGFPNDKAVYSDHSSEYIFAEVQKNGKPLSNTVYQLKGEQSSSGFNIDQLSFSIENGDVVKIKLSTLNAEKKAIGMLDSAVYKIQFTNKKPISEIELAYSIKKSQESKSPFYKNGLEVTPNPFSAFDKNNSRVFYYFEYYPVEFQDSTRYTIQLLDQSNGVVYSTRKVKATNEKMAEVGGYDVSQLPSGRYKLYVSVSSDGGKNSYEASKSVYVLTDTEVQSKKENLSQLALILRSFSAAQIDQLFDQFKYIAEPNEIQIYSRLYTVSDKAKFIERFITLKSENTSSPFDFYLNYMDKIDYANTQYQSRFMSGWKSDRGRVYIMYGKPSDIDKHLSSNETKPYEIWTYNNIEGGIFFVFGDKNDNGMYQLLHSTKRGEISNDSWLNLLNYNSR